MYLPTLNDYSNLSQYCRCNLSWLYKGIANPRFGWKAVLQQKPFQNYLLLHNNFSEQDQHNPEASAPLNHLLTTIATATTTPPSSRQLLHYSNHTLQCLSNNPGQRITPTASPTAPPTASSMAPPMASPTACPTATAPLTIRSQHQETKNPVQ